MQHFYIKIMSVIWYFIFVLEIYYVQSESCNTRREFLRRDSVFDDIGNMRAERFLQLHTFTIFENITNLRDCYHFCNRNYSCAAFAQIPLCCIASFNDTADGRLVPSHFLPQVYMSEMHLQNIELCENGGLILDDATCSCEPRYDGMYCELDRCPQFSCENNGTLYYHSDCHCACGIGFGSTLCETDHCHDLTCENFGTKLPIYDGCVCGCVAGFTGEFCETDEGPVFDESRPLQVDNGFYYGEWGVLDSCPTGSFTTAMQLTVFDGISDDWGVDTITLKCTNPENGNDMGSITSVELNWGTIGLEVACPADYYIVQFQMLSEPSQGGGDDSATNNLAIFCRGPGLHGDDIVQLAGEGDINQGAEWGSISEACPSGMAVSAMQVKYEDEQGWTGDNTAIGDVKLFCGYF